jgi:hypothetical protein
MGTDTPLTRLSIARSETDKARARWAHQRARDALRTLIVSRVLPTRRRSALWKLEPAGSAEDADQVLLPAADAPQPRSRTDMSHALPHWMRSGAHKISSATKPGWGPYLLVILVVLVLVLVLGGPW